MIPAIKGGKCRLFDARVHCGECCASPEFRSLRGIEICPHGRTSETLPIPRTPGGPGTELKRILASIGIKANNCGCERMAAKMDEWGADGCEERVGEIVAAMTKEAELRKWMRVIPLKGTWAELLVNQAITAARKTDALQIEINQPH